MEPFSMWLFGDRFFFFIHRNVFHIHPRHVYILRFVSFHRRIKRRSPVGGHVGRFQFGLTTDKATLTVCAEAV